ncbi:hypothetical protein CL616_00705 [archaeon]|nr:hypothetical protein [archaeon]|tara:strand:- start:91 stop:852 length:762 start_codon:yes stop_codon:yes gene_type:complete
MYVEQVDGSSLVMPTRGDALYYGNGIVSRKPLYELSERLLKSDIIVLDVGDCVRDNPEKSLTYSSVPKRDRWKGRPWAKDTLKQMGVVAWDVFRGRIWSLEEIEDFAVDYAENNIVPYLTNGEVEELLNEMPLIYPGVSGVVQELKKNSDVVIISRGLKETTKHTAEELGIDEWYPRVVDKDELAVSLLMERSARSVAFFGDTWHELEAGENAKVYGFDVVNVQVLKELVLDRRADAGIPQSWKGLERILTFH